MGASSADLNSVRGRGGACNHSCWCQTGGYNNRYFYSFQQLQNPSVGAAAKGGMVVPSAAWSDRLRETTSVADPIALMRAVNGGNGRSTLPSSAQPVPMQHIALQAQLRSLQQAIEAKKIAEARENDLDKGNTLALYTAPIGPMPALSSTGATDSRRTTMDDSMKRSLSDVSQ